MSEYNDHILAECRDIPGYATFAKVTPVREGLSGDAKYRIETDDRRRLMLRVSDIAERERKRAVFDRMIRVAALGVAMPQPIEFGVCGGGTRVYQLLTWCEGEQLAGALPAMCDAKQRALGQKAGVMLRLIHSLPAPAELPDWSRRYLPDTLERIGWYKKSGMAVEGGEAILRYMEDSKHLLEGRPQCQLHGDFHSGNLLVDAGGGLSIIDWELLDFDNYGDPWEEFNRINGQPVLPHFATGLVRGYFGGEPPEEFWRLLALYLSAGALMMISWAYYRERDYLEESLQTARDLLCAYDGMRRIIPRWYLGDIA